MGVKTTKDLSQEQLSNLFKDLVAGTKVLPIGVVNAVPGAIPAAYAPTLQDAEANLCHPKRCGQPKPRKVVKGTESATLVKPNEPDELKGHQDPDPEQLMLPAVVDIKDAFMHSEPYAVTGQQEARYREVQPVDLPIYTAKPWLPVKASESVALSLCDGLGCAALSLKKVGWDEVGVDRIIAVEKSKTARARSVMLLTQLQTPSPEWIMASMASMT